MAGTFYWNRDSTMKFPEKSKQQKSPDLYVCRFFSCKKKGNVRQSAHSMTVTSHLSAESADPRKFK